MITGTDTAFEYPGLLGETVDRPFDETDLLSEAADKLLEEDKPGACGK